MGVLGLIYLIFFVQFSVCALWAVWRGQRCLMIPSSPTLAKTWRSPVTGVTRWSSRAATPPSSDETEQTSSSSRPSRRMKVEIAESACIFNLHTPGTYNCYSNNSLVAKVDLILTITDNVPFPESNSAQQNTEDNSDSDYLRWEQLTWWNKQQRVIFPVQSARSLHCHIHHSAGHTRVRDWPPSCQTSISQKASPTLKSELKTFFDFIKHKTVPQDSPGEDESLELVPNITLNPSFNIDMLEHIEAEYNESSEHVFLVDSAVVPES